MDELEVISDPGVGLGFDTLPEDFSDWGSVVGVNDSDYIAADSLTDPTWALKTGDDVIDVGPAMQTRDTATEYGTSAGDGFLKTALNKWPDALASVIKVGQSTLMSKPGSANNGNSRASTQTSLGSLLRTVGVGTPSSGSYAKPAAGLPLIPLILAMVALFIGFAFIMKGRG